MKSKILGHAKRIMILYTGGTIGMKSTERGLAAVGGFEEVFFERLGDDTSKLGAEFNFRELEPVIDSSSMTPLYWQHIRDAIVQAISVDQSEAVLVLHGTDTLAYSAAALAFQLIGLQAPVVFTGSMFPVGVEDSDAWENIDGALKLLVDGISRGVWLYFHGETFVSTRCTKLRSSGRNPFASPARMKSDPCKVSNLLPDKLEYTFAKTIASVVVVPMYPGIVPEILYELLALNVQGLVLECYGSGTGPSEDRDFINVLHLAKEKGAVVVAITQCYEGGVELDCYAAGSALNEAGVISGAGMTREAAYGKLHMLLGSGLPVPEVRRLFQIDLCGESS
jgi:L-asparaginase